jgi:hypothetical protein
MRKLLRSVRDRWDDMVMMQEIERAATTREQTEREEAAAPFWEEQANLPLFKRDWMWWMEVGLSNIVGVIIALVIAWFVVYGIVAAIGTLI